MEYWEGNMNWKVDTDWVCETCGKRIGMTWGLVHAECRCDNCHTPYMMRDYNKDGDPIITIPISQLKEEYKEPLKLAWQKYSRPIDGLTKEEWEEFAPK